jgi:hypothetical protein
MYFVTINKPGYVLFSATPSERAALALTDKQIVHLLARDARSGEWKVLRTWKASDYAHTDFMVALHHLDEPDDPHKLLDLLPANLPEA